MQGDIKQIERVLKALANKRRLLIIKYLKAKKEATVGDIAEFIKLSFKATSKHLSVLKSADIIEYEQRSLLYFYRLTSPLPAPARPILTLL